MDKRKIKLLRRLLEDYNPSFLDFVDNQGLNAVNSFKDLCKLLEENNAFISWINGSENALNYLAKNDPTLKISINIAIKANISVEEIDSELLANLLATHENMFNFSCSVEPKYDELFPNL